MLQMVQMTQIRSGGGFVLVADSFWWGIRSFGGFVLVADSFRLGGGN
jgi:hypothetical protein